MRLLSYDTIPLHRRLPSRSGPDSFPLTRNPLAQGTEDPMSARDLWNTMAPKPPRNFRLAVRCVVETVSQSSPLRKNKFSQHSPRNPLLDQTLKIHPFLHTRHLVSRRMGCRVLGNEELTAILVRKDRNLKGPYRSRLACNLRFIHPNQGAKDRQCSHCLNHR